MIPATCHPDKKHRALGLCDTCYVRKRYNERPRTRAVKAAIAARSYRKHAGAMRAKNLARYLRAHPNRVPRAVRIELAKVKRLAPKPKVIVPSVREWWRLPEEAFIKNSMRLRKVA